MASRSGRSKTARVGSQVGDFILREQIGSGSFAFVHRAKNLRRGGYAAVKCVVLSRLSESKKLKENLHGEIKIMKSINHPHVVSLMDCRESPGEKPEYIYLVMEYCQMGDLSHFIKNRENLSDVSSTLDAFKKYPNPRPGGLNEVFVRHFVKQLASALEFLHRKNLIHRDLKPQNVLVAPSLQSRESAQMFVPERVRNLQPVGVPSLPILKIADFGFARILPPQGLAETLCGSPLYMAPEILAYKKYDAKADLWSFGALIYEMVTGRPPFRAGNHLELYRVIEKANDQIRFPAEVSVSGAVKDLIRSLLRRKPVERVAFEDFFRQEVITGEIPGLVESDRLQTEAVCSPEALQAAAMERTKSAEREQEASPSSAAPQTKVEEVYVDAVDRRAAQVPSRPKPEQTATAPPGQVPQVSPKTAEKPPIARHSTDMPPPSSPASASRRSTGSRRPSITQRQGYRTPPQQQENRDERERAAQDVADEREYVVVEKKAVEMNALADEFQASPRMQSNRYSSSHSRQSSRQSGAAFQPSSAPIGNQYSPSRTAQVANANKPDHLRRASFEKRAKQSSASSALAKAINMAAGRLINIGGFGASPPVGNRASGTTPFPAYGPFPAYQAQTSYMVEDGKQQLHASDDDAKALHAIEETATKSDVVYGFAQVKYMQIIPQQPSAEHGLGLRLDSGGEQAASEENGDLTPDALVTICEEALVLYVKTLSLLARSMDIAGVWWAKRNRTDAADAQQAEAGRESRQGASAAARINSVVQWVRGRFNEALEKATFVRLKLIETQKRLPEDHASHPNNHPELPGPNAAHIPATPGAPAGTPSDAQQAAAASSDAYISPGITADRIMYQRAVEMMRQAAVNELMNEDLPGCEIGYITAIRMLEVVIESGQADKGDDSKQQPSSSPSKKDKEEDTLDPEDRDSVMKMLQTATGRLQGLRKKMTSISRRTSATPAPQRSPKPRPASLSPAHASAR